MISLLVKLPRRWPAERKACCGPTLSLITNEAGRSTNYRATGRSDLLESLGHTRW